MYYKSFNSSLPAMILVFTCLNFSLPATILVGQAILPAAAFLGGVSESPNLVAAMRGRLPLGGADCPN
jgi:hypothetical protein